MAGDVENAESKVKSQMEIVRLKGLSDPYVANLLPGNWREQRRVMNFS